MVGVILLAVVPLLSQPWTDLKCMLRSDRHVSHIEQFVPIGSQENSVVHLMRPLDGIGLDMGSLKHWQRLLASHGTLR
jgi:hypothetical protein